jgi:hypothetical protein
LRNEGVERAAQLVRFGPVFGIIDDGKSAARERQRDIKRLRLGAWTDVGRDDDLERRGKLAACECRAGFRVVVFDDQLDVEFLGGIVRSDGASATNLRKQGFFPKLAVNGA